MNYFNPRNAIVRDIPNSFSDCLKLHEPSQQIDVKKAQQQHSKYTQTLRDIGLKITELPALESHPDCCFVEDTAVVINGRATINHLGAKERRGEESAIESTLQKLNIEAIRMKPPANLDGGDVLFTNRHIFVGISQRTNVEGAKQLAEVFSDYPVITSPVLGTLHFKSVLSALNEETLLVGETDAARTMIAELNQSFKLEEKYNLVWLPDVIFANVLAIGENLILQEGFPESERILTEWLDRNSKMTFKIHKLNMSEMIKADGALTCCSLLF